MKLTAFSKTMFIAIGVIVLLISLRIFYTGSIRYSFMVWNLFLGWIPYALSNYFETVRFKSSWKQVFLYVSWLLFLPNALYMVTDLIHLRADNPVPIWFDAAILFSASFVGILMAFVSIQHSVLLMQHKLSQKTMKFYIPFILLLSSFGVYLGRFERWNSWDVLRNPFALAENIVQIVLSPHLHVEVWATTILLFLVYGTLYLLITTMPSLRMDKK